ncbi:hypothetical protein HOLleu_26285 [Holothuria leucospilota]|uniref:Reverse transcriptase domain-containing protein n=1 Tax=Holothuria leucospilota TaxID=206669 RepID=A0A9Q1BT44_HOLLE|nr:hypothetical protein HOLleu_26285 [Holothuria leucospilota]
MTLTLNNFQFNGKHYLQIQGTAMGTSVAPSYANIFMGTLAQEIHNLTSYILPNIWKSFIDDIQFLWTSTSRNLSLFQTLITTQTPYKYTFNSSQDNIQFLDIQITQNNKQLETKIYSKPTFTHTYFLHHVILSTLLLAFHTVRFSE